jgi:hypothetical protein
LTQASTVPDYEVPAQLDASLTIPHPAQDTQVSGHDRVSGTHSIPDVRAGDSVWWHCDIIHSVAPVQNQQGWGNVMYVPAAPWCPRNGRYAANVREALVTGSSPSDFPAEHYERTWTNRFQPHDLNDTGRRGLGLALSAETTR